MSEDPPWNKAARLGVAGVVVPRLRGQNPKSAHRRVARVDSEGKVVGYITLAELQESLLQQRAIEVEVVDGVRPPEYLCQACGRTSPAPEHGGEMPKLCAICRSPPCVDCDKPIRNGGYQRSVRCRTCRIKFQSKELALLNCSVCATELTRSASISWHNRDPSKARCRRCADAARAAPDLACTECGKPLGHSVRSRAAKQTVTSLCGACWRRRRTKPEPTCAGCGVSLPRKMMTPSAIARRRGSPPCCSTCRPRRPDVFCACGVKLSPYAMSPSVVARRKGPARCPECLAKERARQLNETKRKIRAKRPST